MAEEKVKVELELPKEQVNVEPADEKPEGSYALSDIAKAPIEPPKSGAKSSPNIHQRVVMVLGFVLILAGLASWPIFGFTVFISVAIAGAAVIAFATLVRI